MPTQEIAAHAPLLIRVPGLTDLPNSPHRSPEYVEFVDIMPTLADFGGVPIPPLCAPDSKMTRLCTEGVSLRPILSSATVAHQGMKTASFSVYPRYSGSNQWKQAMGYSMATKVNGVRYRYTEWVPFDSKKNQAHFDVPAAQWCPSKRCMASRELYNHNVDLLETRNVADSVPAALIATLSSRLRAGWRKAGNAPAASSH